MECTAPGRVERQEEPFTSQTGIGLRLLLCLVLVTVNKKTRERGRE